MTEKLRDNLFTDKELELMAIVSDYGKRAMDLSRSAYKGVWFNRDDVRDLNNKLAVIEMGIKDKRGYEYDWH